MPERPRVLIEDRLPIEKIGAESLRDASAAKKPPLNRLHVWWARRPLTVSRAAILGSLLPAWSEEIADLFATADEYEKWFLKLIGIFGDPAAGRRLLAAARERGEVIANPYTYGRAFTHNPDREQIETLHELLRRTWGTAELAVLDSFAGGGSIPFEALRYGFTTYANELNPVAAVILKATLDYPARFGKKLVPLIRKYGDVFAEEVRRRLRPYFTQHEESADLVGACYLWARTVACPYTGKPIPLSPNWWLVKGAKPVAVKPVFRDDADEATFLIVKGKAAVEQANPDKGTVSRGNAVSPWAHWQAVDGDYIKKEAQAGRMGQQLYAIGLKKKGGFEFRPPEAADLEAVKRAEAALEEKLPAWEAAGLVPNESYPRVATDMRPLHYGMPTWADFFAPRQLLSLCTALEVLREVSAKVREENGDDIAAAVQTYLGFAIDKAADYNSRMVRFDGTRNKIANTFDRHDFSFKWSPSEFDAAHNLFPWAVDQVTSATSGIVDLIDPRTQDQFVSAGLTAPASRLHFSLGNAGSLDTVADSSIRAVVVDPPYYDNVQYSECSDFFYVWQKRSVGPLYDGWFSDELTNKDDEAVANPARFAEMGRRRAEMADQDYERKMQGCFREMHRVLVDDGVLTVMFTHKKVEAWDTLGMALIEAGFAVHSSWPVHTESEHSLHQAKKNAAASTILLTCRKRTMKSEPVWWDDIKGKVRETAREKAEEYEKQGIRGVDLYIATFGPVLAVISERWPVQTSDVDERTGQPKSLRPEAALEIAREEVIGLRKRGLLLGRDVEFDPVSDWYLMAWDAFKAEEFPGDEARKLAIAMGLGLEDTLVKTKKVVSKKSQNVVLQQPKARRKRGCVDDEAETFECVLDAAHTAMLVFDEDGAQTARQWLRRRGLDNDARLKSFFQAAVNALPPQKKAGKYVRPEMALLDRMNDALALGLAFPAEEEPEPQQVQGELFDNEPEPVEDED